MERKTLYAFRGWIAFVAFMDLGTAVRSYIEKRSFLTKTLLETDYVDGKLALIDNFYLLIPCKNMFYRRVYYIKNFGNIFNFKSHSFNTLYTIHTL